LIGDLVCALEALQIFSEQGGCYKLKSQHLSLFRSEFSFSFSVVLVIFRDSWKTMIECICWPKQPHSYKFLISPAVRCSSRCNGGRGNHDVQLKSASCLWDLPFVLLIIRAYCAT